MKLKKKTKKHINKRYIIVDLVVSYTVTPMVCLMQNSYNESRDILNFKPN